MPSTATDRIEYAIPLTVKEALLLGDCVQVDGNIATNPAYADVARAAAAQMYDRVLTLIHEDALDEAWTNGYREAAAEWAKPSDTDPR